MHIGEHPTYGFELLEEPRATLDVSSLQTFCEVYEDGEETATGDRDGTNLWPGYHN